MSSLLLQDFQLNCFAKSSRVINSELWCCERHCKGSCESRERRDTYIAHILRQKVLKSLAHRIALSHDALSAIITRAWRVSHEGSTTDDALQSLLQRGPEALLAERQRVHNNLFLQGKRLEDALAMEGNSAAHNIFLISCYSKIKIHSAGGPIWHTDKMERKK